MIEHSTAALLQNEKTKEPIIDTTSDLIELLINDTILI